MTSQDMPGPRSYITESISDFRKNFLYLFSISLLIQSLFYLGNLIKFLVDNDYMAITEVYQFILVILIYVSLGIVGLFFTLILILSILKKDFDFASSLKLAKHYFWSLVWVNVMKSVVIILGYILLIIPGIILSLMLIFSDLALLDQNLKGAKALGYSRAITKRKKWYVLVNFLSLAFYFAIIPFIIGIASALLGNMELFIEIFTFIYSVLTLPIIITYNIKVYSYLKSSKDLL